MLRDEFENFHDYITITLRDGSDVIDYQKQVFCCKPCARKVFEQFKKDLGGHK